MRFEAVVANPPFSAKWNANPIFESDDRFSPYGRLAPSSKADYAFVQHMLYQLGENGTMAVILPHGALFRGGAEGHIRQYLIKDQNWLDAVIGLPANIFYGTSIPTCIMVFKKCRENPENILFIDASAHFEKASNQNYLRDADVEKIVSTYRERKAEPRYSHVAPLSEVEENDYNLNIPRYVDTFEAEEPINLDDVVLLLDDSQEAFEEADAIIARFCRKLNLPELKGVNVSLLETYKRGVMQKLFSQEVRFKQEDGSSFPDWEEKALGTICLLLKDGTHRTHVDMPQSGFFLLSAKNIRNGKVIFDNSDRNIPEAEFEAIHKSYNLRKNDILLSIVGTIGRVAIFWGQNNIAFQRSVAFYRARRQTQSGDGFCGPF